MRVACTWMPENLNLKGTKKKHKLRELRKKKVFGTTRTQKKYKNRTSSTPVR